MSSRPRARLWRAVTDYHTGYRQPEAPAVVSGVGRPSPDAHAEARALR